MTTTKPQSTTEPTLEPCPFCPHGVGFVRNESGRYNGVVWVECDWPSHAVKLTAGSDAAPPCGARTAEYQTEEEAIKAWNARISPASAAPVVDTSESYAPRYPWHSTENDYQQMLCKHCREPIRQVITTWIHADDNVFCFPRQPKQAEPSFKGEKHTMNLPDIEIVSAKVHEAWMDSKKAQGVTTRRSEKGEELMVPYAELSEESKELDRGTVRAVFQAIQAIEEG